MDYLVHTHDLTVTRACCGAGLSRSAWYRPLKNRLAYDQPLIDVLQALAEAKPGLGFWKLYRRLRRQGYSWNHKRVHRVYCELKLNIWRRTKKRIPARAPQPLLVPLVPNQVWSADFMSDALYGGTRFRTFNVLDDFNREALAIEVDVFNYIEVFYNRKRRHSHLGGDSPEAFERTSFEVSARPGGSREYPKRRIFNS